MRFLEHARISALALLVVTSLHSTAVAQSLPAPVLREAYPLSADAPRPDPNPDPNPDPTPGGTVNFTEDATTDIRNPERGFYRTGVIDIMKSSAPNFAKFYDVDRETIGYQRADIGDWVNSDHLPASLISTMKKNLAAVRGSGIKMVLRFKYSSSKDSDATKARQLNHIADLKSVFTEYADVIAYVEAGFIGAFGEWHDSRYIGNDTGNAQDVQDMKDIAGALMNSVPPNRMIAFRAPRYLMAVFGSTPTSAAQAFSETDKARAAAHADGILTNKTHGFTIQADRYDAETAYWTAQTRYSLLGGESNGVGGTCTGATENFICGTNSECASHFGSKSTCDTHWSGCANSKSEAAKIHLTSLNDGVFWSGSAEVIQRWKNEGCYDEIRRNLGYRFVLKSATFVGSVNRGASFGLSVTLRNDGYANLYNPRTVYVTLKSATARRDIALRTDPRHWDSGGANETITEQIAVPADLPVGTYELSLWLPDEANTLRNDPKYAIRMANNGTWNATLGLNKLGTIQVK